MGKESARTAKTTFDRTDNLVGFQNPSGTPASRRFTQSAFTKITYPMQSRLSLTSATPVTTSDVTGAGTIYWTPYLGDAVSLYYGGDWNTYTLTEKSLALTATSGSVYDLFGYYTGSALALESLVFSTGTARATALSVLNGRLVKSGDSTRLYLGTFCASGTNTTEDSIAKRYLYNYYNRMPRKMKCVDGTNSWAYTTTAFQEIRAGSTLGTSRVGFCVGWNENLVTARATHFATASSGNPVVSCGIGLDGTTNAADISDGKAMSTTIAGFNASYSANVAVGVHYLAMLEYGGANVTFYGDNGTTQYQSGMIAEVWA